MEKKCFDKTSDNNNDTVPALALVKVAENFNGSTTISEVCKADLFLPQSETDKFLLAGHMEPDTLFDLTFRFKDPKTSESQGVLIKQSGTNGGGSGCVKVQGADLFYAGRSQSMLARERSNATESEGISAFFFVNTEGETYFGLTLHKNVRALRQTRVPEGNWNISSSATNNDSSSATEEDNRPVYAIVDVILSGSARLSQTSWLVQDTAPDVAQDWSSPSKTTGRGRAVLKRTGTNGAGAVLGPLPASNFCIDIIIVEASVGANQATIVDFIPGSGGGTGPGSTSYPSSLNISRVDRDVIKTGGLRFCANSCIGDHASSGENTLNCFSKKDGSVVCPGSEAWGLEGTTGDAYDDTSGDPSSNSKTSEKPSDTASGVSGSDNADAIGNDHIEPTVDTRGETEDHISGGGGVGGLWFWAAIMGGLGIIAGLVVLVIGHRRKRRAEDTSLDGKAPNKVEMGHLRFFSNSSILNKGAQDIAVALEAAASSQQERMETLNPAALPTFKVYAAPNGHSYYCNTRTGEVSWTLPEGGVVVE
eukprot:g3080.t1